MNETIEDEGGLKWRKPVLAFFYWKNNKEVHEPRSDENTRGVVSDEWGFQILEDISR